MCWQELEQSGIEHCVEYLSEDVEWDVHGPYASGSYRGHKGVQEFFEKLSKITSSRKVTCDDENFFRDVTKLAVHVIGVEEGFLVEGDQRAYQNHFDHTFWYNSDGKIYKTRINAPYC